jgi:hypothetical protein
MTPEQQGALLLAHHQGKTIEKYDVSCSWSPLVCKPQWSVFNAYRIKQEPVVYVHTSLTGATGSTYVLTYDTEDGVPVCSSVKLSQLT